MGFAWGGNVSIAKVRRESGEGDYDLELVRVSASTEHISVWQDYYTTTEKIRDAGRDLSIADFRLGDELDVRMGDDELECTMGFVAVSEDVVEVKLCMKVADEDVQHCSFSVLGDLEHVEEFGRALTDFADSPVGSVCSFVDGVYSPFVCSQTE